MSPTQRNKRLCWIKIIFAPSLFAFLSFWETYLASVSVMLFITDWRSVEKVYVPVCVNAKNKAGLQKRNRKLEFDSCPVRARQGGSCDLKLEQVRTLWSPSLPALEDREEWFREWRPGSSSELSVPSLTSITNSLKVCVLDVCNKTNLHHRAAVRSDQLMFSGHFWDLKMKGTYGHEFHYSCCPRMKVFL